MNIVIGILIFVLVALAAIGLLATASRGEQ